MLIISAIAVAFVAPTESSMGDAQRVLYIHVPVAWIGLLSFGVMAMAGLLYLATRNLYWDHWAHAAAELGWLACGLTLVTGALWAEAAWGTAWTWDPRLTASLVLWLIYGGCLVVRRSVESDHRRARIGAVLACIGAVDVPLVIMATRWFRGMHPVAPEMEGSMRMVLWINVASFTMLFAVLLIRRKTLAELESSVGDLERRYRVTEEINTAGDASAGLRVASY